MKYIFGLLIISIALGGFAQHNIPPTDNFRIEGKVKQGMTVSLQDLSSYQSYSIDSIVITSHLGQRKEILKAVKGVLLKDILNRVEIDAESPKVLSEYYLVCVASDNYKVVFSWNEIFNTDTGKSVYIITELDGKAASTLETRTALISPKDQMTGRRYVMGLQKIIVERTK